MKKQFPIIKLKKKKNVCVSGKKNKGDFIILVKVQHRQERKLHLTGSNESSRLSNTRQVADTFLNETVYI